MVYRSIPLALLVTGSLVIAGAATAEPPYSPGATNGTLASGSNSYNAPGAATGNVLSVSFDSSDERTEIEIDRLMGTDPEYRFETYRPRESRDDADATSSRPGSDGPGPEPPLRGNGSL